MLALEVLKTLSKTCSTQNLKTLLSSGDLKVANAKKPLKTGKRTGRRFFKGNSQAGKGDGRLRKKPAAANMKEFLGFYAYFFFVRPDNLCSFVNARLVHSVYFVHKAKTTSISQESLSRA